MYENVASLEIISFKRIQGIGAEHYYGNLYVGRNTMVDMCYAVGKEEADKLNKKDVDSLFEYAEGDSCSRFFSIAQLLHETVEYLKAEHPEVVLLVGGVDRRIPSEVLWYSSSVPADVVEALDDIWSTYMLSYDAGVSFEWAKHVQQRCTAMWESLLFHLDKYVS